MKRFIVNISRGYALEKYETRTGKKSIHNFLLFLDNDGVYVSTRQGKVYLTPENCEVI